LILIVKNKKDKMLFIYLEGTEKYLQDFRRPAYNAALKWKPKSELSRV